MPRTLTHTATEPLSARDAAWLEELGDAVARGRAALAARVPRLVTACESALALACLADAGGASPECESLVRRLARERLLDATEAAAVLTALARSGNATRAACAGTVHDGVSLLLESQNRDGGWSAPAPDAARGPSCAALTGRALEALGHFGFRVGQRPAGDAVKFLLARQDDGGAWGDATADVLAGLREAGSDVYAMPVRRAVRWLKESQNEDGGWGRRGESTAGDTAGALLALLTTDEAEGPEARAAAEYLVGTQRADGTWRDAAGCAILLLALARYARAAVSSHHE